MLRDSRHLVFFPVLAWCACRGDLPLINVATVYTFGAPAVFCEGANGSPPTPGACQSCSLPCEHRKAHSAAASSATDSLLTKLGLPADAVVNVIMTRDIVPRAFVCDYTLVAGVLKSWLPSFKEHKGLAACKEHKVSFCCCLFLCPGPGLECCRALLWVPWFACGAVTA